MFKKVLKNSLWVGLVLAVGQISISGKTIGRYFIEGVGHSFVWSGHQVLTTKWMAGFDHPDWLDSFFEVEKKKINTEHLTEKERAEIRKILE